MNLDDHPIVPHGGDCCGCLIVVGRGDHADLVS
jgi:hypothetical protein